MQFGSPQQYVRLQDNTGISVGDTLTFTNSKRSFDASVDGIGVDIVNDPFRGDLKAIMHINGSGIPTLDDVITSNNNAAVNTAIAQEMHCKVTASNVVTSENSLDAGGGLAEPYEIFINRAEVSIASGRADGANGVNDLLSNGGILRVGDFYFDSYLESGGGEIIKDGIPLNVDQSNTASFVIDEDNYFRRHTLSSSSNGLTVTIERNDKIPLNATIELMQRGAGEWNIVAGANITLRGNKGTLAVGDHELATVFNNRVVLRKRTEVEWWVENPREKAKRKITANQVVNANEVLYWSPARSLTWQSESDLASFTIYPCLLYTSPSPRDRG